MSQPTVICFGEILWDLLPSGKVAGGAPMNVAFQLKQLGVSVGMISRVGKDDLGDEILRFLQEKKVPTDFVQRDQTHPTGTVKVEWDKKGHPVYEIVPTVAWDFIEADHQAIEAVKNAQVMVFGSLVSRCETSKNALLTLMENARLRVLDVNLRKPFFSKDLLVELLQKAQIVKMNDDELAIISTWLGFAGEEEQQMSRVKSHFQLDLLIVTRGEKGALTLGATGLCRHPGCCIEVADTIGSGDAFLAGYLSKFLSKNTPDECLDFACRMGAFVATQRGGTPVLNIDNQIFA